MITETKGFQRIFTRGELTVGIFFPLETDLETLPAIEQQVSLAKEAEELGFAALWVRDIPLYNPSLRDSGKVYDPWVSLSYLAAHTQTIALATDNIIFPLRHPLHLAKAAASVDNISHNRLVLGITSGDRALEFPAFRVNFSSRGERFRQTFYDFQQVLRQEFPVIRSPLTNLEEADLFPKPLAQKIPLLVTGYSEQSLEWIAEHADGWLDTLSPVEQQQQMIQRWHYLTQRFTPGVFKPYGQFLSIDLLEEPTFPPTPIEFGYRLGSQYLLELLYQRREWGVNHVALHLQSSQRPVKAVLTEIGKDILPKIHSYAF